jgi:hypothetical protein
MADHTPQLGAPDPELKNSPIVDEDEEPSLDLQPETGVCYFHDVAYSLGQYVLSGSELLRCTDRGAFGFAPGNAGPDPRPTRRAALRIRILPSTEELP